MWPRPVRCAPRTRTATGSGSVKIRVPQGPEEPVILRITLSGTVRSGHIRARLPRRPVWRRFRRRPPPRALAAP